MAPGNKERHPGHTGTIPKTKLRNNCNVPQEAVTPTRRDMTTNLVTTSLDWVPVSEYNTRTNSNQSRKPSNNTSDHELTDLDNSVAFESGFGRFVPVRPQPRALPLTVQNRENVTTDHHDDVAGASVSHTLHPYAHQMQNGLNPHSNHAAAAVMIVNPTTPNAVTGNMSQQFNGPIQNRSNLNRNLNSARNTFEANSNNNNSTPPLSSSRSGTKTVNITNNMYEQGQGSFNNVNENNHVNRESARALGEAIVAACPDAAAVERRLGQIREYIRVTSSLVDTMRNSEDEAFIEHTKEEYDELVEMVMKLKESESKLQDMLVDSGPENVEVPVEEENASLNECQPTDAGTEDDGISKDKNINKDKTRHHKNINDPGIINNNLKKVTNIENEQLNKTMSNIKEEEIQSDRESNVVNSTPESNNNVQGTETVQIEEIESIPCNDAEIKKDDENLNAAMKKNILSCLEKVALIEEMRNKNKNNPKAVTNEDKALQDIVVRPVSVQSNGSTYSENEIWQNEIKNKMEMSQIRLEALKQQQKRLLKYQAEAKAQLEEINKERQTQDMSLPSTSHDNFNGMQNVSLSANYHQANRMYAANQIGVATTLPQSSEVMHTSQQMAANNIDNEHRSMRSNHSHDERFSIRDGNIASSEEAAAGGRDSEADDDESVLNERSRLLQMKLRELQLKKQHMENLVSEFQKLQMVTRQPSSHNTYSSSGEDSGDDEPSRKCNKSSVNNKNEDPFKLMEIKAIRTALQKTKDLMRSVENYEAEHLSGVHEDTFQIQGHSNIHDNKSEGGGSMGGWSNDGSLCRVRNSLPQRHKFTNEQHSQQLQHQQQLHHQQLQQQQLHQQQLQQQQHLQHQHSQLQQHPQQQQQNHEANINTLQELAQELRMETEKIMGERARIKDLVANKEGSRKQKKVNEEARGGGGGGAMTSRTMAMGPAEARQMQLRALLAEKQRELEALLNKEKVMCSATESQNRNADSHNASVANQSYNSEQEEPESRSEHITMESQNIRENENFRGGGDSALGSRSANTAPSHLGSTFGSDSDSASRNKSNQRARIRRRQTLDRQSDENNAVQMQSNNTLNANVRHESRVDAATSNMPPPVAHNNEGSANSPYPHLPPPSWNSTKSNQQDSRSNQFTQNSHSQTMDRLLGTPQVSFPPAMPYNMMMPYGMVGGCGCGCALWGAWCWQQLALQQREIHQLRDQLTHLEERWRAENASHTLNNQVPPGNRANNYWDNFRSYSRQNLLSTNSKTNADGHLGASPAHNQQPLVERSHNTLHGTLHTSSSTSPSVTPKRNTDGAGGAGGEGAAAAPAEPQPRAARAARGPRRNVAYERSLSFSSAPDVLNVNQPPDDAGAAPPRNDDAPLNVNRPDPAPHFRNLSITNPIPEIVQSHSNNLAAPGAPKRKSSSKLPSKNSANRRNYALDFSQTSNINIAGTSETPNPNLASTSREIQDKATSKLFDLLRENVYSEVTTLIGVNESHPDFLIQIFRELQLISSDPLRQKVLQSIRNILSQYSNVVDGNQNDPTHEESATEAVTTTSGEPSNYHDCNVQNPCSSTIQIDNKIVRFLLLKSEETFTPDLLESLVSLIISGSDGRQQRRVLDFLSKYEGLRVCDVSGDIIENLPLFIAGSNEADESTHLTSEVSESSILQDVAGSLNLFSSSETQLHQLNSCPYDMWPGHVHMDIDGRDLNDNSPRSSQDSKMDLINCSEMHNGDLAEADQTCRTDVGEAGTSSHSEELAVNTDTLPDVVDTEEVTPTEAEAEWIGLDRVPTRLHVDDTSEKQKD